LTQGGEIIHDANENNQIIEYSFRPSSSLVLIENNYSNQLAHEIYPTHPSLDLQSG